MEKAEQFFYLPIKVGEVWSLKIVFFRKILVLRDFVWVS